MASGLFERWAAWRRRTVEKRKIRADARPAREACVAGALDPSSPDDGLYRFRRGRVPNSSDGDGDGDGGDGGEGNGGDGGDGGD